MGNDAYDGQVLAEKLRKLNNSQQSIECIQHLPVLFCLGCFNDDIHFVISALSSSSTYIMAMKPSMELLPMFILICGIHVMLILF